MQNRVVQHILNVKNYTPGKPIEEVQREYGLSEVIKLASNENCMGPSPKALAAIRKNLGRINRYPDASSFYLKKRLAALHGIKPENIVLGNGSDEVICLAARAFVGSGDEVVIAKPTFLIYEIVSQLQNARIRFVPLRSDLRHDLRAMKASVTERTKIVFIANPDNPTGTYVTRAELGEFLRGLPKKVLVFLDEAYFEFADHGCKDYPNGMSYFGMRNLIVARSFSKAYGLAGLRIGYAVAQPDVAGYLERVREPFNINLLAQVAAEAALGDRAFLRKTVGHVQKEKEFFYAAFRELGLTYVPSATNFVIFDTRRDGRQVFKALLARGLIVRDMAAWGLNTFVRVTVGTRAENKRFIRALKEVLS